jgi:hypothetical protein
LCSRTFPNKNPGFQISFYMQHAGTEWGILTNERLWRLYHRDTVHKLDRFYEVDLHALATGGGVEAFPYFYAFFHRSAFDEHPLGVRAMLEESTEYARSVGDSLKGQVYEALRHLAQGFLDYPPNGLVADPGTLREVYDNSLILLYRLLFVLYAEARDLLPVRESEMYRDTYSLQAIKHDVARGRALLPTSATLWPRLKQLFDIIDRGSPPLEVATFNGGLFDPVRHPFLERHTVGDGHLQEAVDMLARVDGQFVDYRDLAERHLGTIYEGLLEYHLEALDGVAREEGWTVALLNDKGERKATGSYYTPDYVVKYVVEETVGPVLREAVEDARSDGEKVEAVLALNVLDPSMGSGHFLVEVTEYVARFLVELGVTPQAGQVDGGADPGEAELAHWKRRVAQSCVYGVDLNPLAVDLAKLSLWLATVAKDRPLSFLDHHLRCGNSLVGARLSDLAPSDDRKRRKKKKEDDASQLSMTSDPVFQSSMSTAVGSMWLIEERPADTVEDVKEQERLYERLRENLTRRYARLADLATATFFGVEVDRAHWKALGDYAAGRIVYAPPQFQRWLDEAAEIADEKRFFHWELEFPEVFFDRQGRPLGEDAGFDAVVGNPPYVRQEGLGEIKGYFASAYPETYHGVADLYVYFYQQGLRQLRRGGRMSYIVTNKWLRAGYGEPLRSYFAAEGVLEEILDFGHAPIFPDADVFPCIVVLRKPKPHENDANGRVRVAEFPREALGKVDLDRYVAEHGHTVSRKRFGRGAWSLEPAAVDDLMQKIRDKGIPLAEFAGTHPLAGIKTGFNEAFLVSTKARDHLIWAHPSLTDHIKPYLRGRDIKRWSSSWEELWIILLRSSNDFSWPWANFRDKDAEDTFHSAFPALYEHMHPWKERLQLRSDQGKFWWELRSWAHYDAFDRSNIFYQDLAFHSRFGLGEPKTVAEMTCFCLPTSDKWILTVLNSPLMWAYMWRNVIHGKDEVLRLKNIYTETLPIAPPTDEVRTEAGSAVERLVEITNSEQQARRAMLDWLRTEFGVEKPDQKLADFAALDAGAFVEEVRKRRPKNEGRLTPGALRDLRAGYAEMARPVREDRAEAASLEKRLSDLVNEAYGLTPEEIELLGATAPPRMPRF